MFSIIMQKTCPRDVGESYCSPRDRQNIVNVCAAGTCSAGGSILSIIYAANPWISIAGGCISGMANGLGVYLQCTSPKDPAITTLEMKVADQEMQLFAQQKQIETLQLLMERNFPRESETIDR